MKNFIVGVLVAVMFVPAISFANQADLEDTRIELLQQIVELLQLKLNILLQERGLEPLPLVLGIATTVETEEDRPRRRGGGGGSSSNNSSDSDESAETVATTTDSVATSTATSTTDVATTTDTGAATASTTAQPELVVLADSLEAQIAAMGSTTAATSTEEERNGMPDAELQALINSLLAQIALLEAEQEPEPVDNLTLAGEAQLSQVSLFPIIGGTIEPGDQDIALGDIVVGFTDGDAELTRLELALLAAGETDTSQVAPWEIFEDVSLWVDGTRIAELYIGEANEYLDPNTGTVRFSHLDQFVPENEPVTIVVAASLARTFATSTITDWSLTATGLRYFDADGVGTNDSQFGDLGGDDAIEFTITEPPQPELEFSLSSNNPDATAIIVDEDNETTGVTLFVFDLEAEDSEIELDQAAIRVETPGVPVTDVLEDAYLEIDGYVFDYADVLAVDGVDRAMYLFDIDGDIEIDRDDTVEAQFVVDFTARGVGQYEQGQTIQALVDGATRDLWAAEGYYGDIDANSDFSGTAIGDEHQLISEGILVHPDGFHSGETTYGENDEIGEFTLEFDVVAVEGDFYISDTATSDTTTQGVRYYVDGFGLSSAIETASLTSTADEDMAGVFTVREGETETFTLTVTVDPEAAGTYRVGLEEVWFSSSPDGVSATEAFAAVPASDYRTSALSIQN